MSKDDVKSAFEELQSKYSLAQSANTIGSTLGNNYYTTSAGSNVKQPAQTPNTIGAYPWTPTPSPMNSMDEYTPDDNIRIVPLNSGYLLIKGNKHVAGGKEYHCFSTFQELIKWLSNNPILTLDESIVAESI